MVYKKDLSYSSIHWHESIYSPEDRHQHNKNMVFKKTQTRPLSAMDLQQQQLDSMKHGQQNIEWTPITRRPYTVSTSSKCLARRSMSSFPLHYSRSATLYQPQLENYHHHDNLSQKQIDRLSNQYSSSGTIQQLLQHTPSLTSKLSSLSSSSSAQSNELYSDATVDDTYGSVAEKGTNAPNQNHQTKPLPISPPSPPTSSSTSFSSPKTSTLVPLPTSITILPKKEDFYYPSVTHIQKNNGMRLRSFLCQSVLLGKTIRLKQHILPNNPSFFKGTDEQTGQEKAILKLSIIKLSSKYTEYSTMASFGIGFINSTSAGKSGGGSKNKYASIPDALVLEALCVWLSHLHLPHLSHASHIMRVGVKLYIVFDISAIQ